MDVHGVAVSAQVAACTVSDTEVSIQRIYCISRSLPMLPLLPEHAGGSASLAARDVGDGAYAEDGGEEGATRSGEGGGGEEHLSPLHARQEEDGGAGEGGEVEGASETKVGAGVLLETRLNARVLDLRSLRSQVVNEAIMRW